MGFEEIEDIYKRDRESAEKEFLEGIKKNGKLKEFEEIYRSKLRSAREKYYKLISDELKRKKAPEKKKKKKEKPERFRLKPGSFELGFFQKLKFKLSLVSFRFWFRLRNFVKKETPFFISYNFLKVRRQIKRFFLGLIDLFSRFVGKIEDYFRLLFETVKNFLVSFYKKMEGFILGLVRKIFRKKGESKDKDGKKERGGNSFNSDQSK